MTARRQAFFMAIGMVGVLVMGLGGAAYAQEKTAGDYIAVFAEGGEKGPEMAAALAAVHGLVALGEAAVEPLLTALKHESKFVRANAATALGRIGA